MIISNIKLKNFRNIEDLNIDPHYKLNYFFGDNAQGKTNIIESIHYCSFLKSYRNKNNFDLIKNDSDFFYINLTVKNNNIVNNLKVYFDRKKNKNIKIDNNTPDGSEFYKKINSIIYYPDEINYLNLYPQYRRNFIDRSIFLLDTNYLTNFSKYKKILKNRNNLLKRNEYNKELDSIWIESLVIEAVHIIKKRKIFLDSINKLLLENSINNEKYQINYKDYKVNHLYDFLKEKIENSLEKDLKLGYTTIGPHSDDFIFEINNNDIRKYSSEGQKKSFLLKLKKAQITNYFDLYENYPVLIIDDIANELDKNRKNKYLSDLIENSGQVFITTTDIEDKYDTNCSVFEVANGKVIY